MEDPLKYSDLTGTVIGIFFEVYNELGHRFLESVYQSAIQIAFAERGIANVGKIEIPVWFRGHKVGDFEADLLVENCVFLELKAVRQLDSAHQAQLLNYLRNRPRGRLAVELWNQTPVQKDAFRQFSEEKGPTVRLTRGPTYAKPGRNRVASCRSQILFISVHPRLIISCHGFGLLR